MTKHSVAFIEHCRRLALHITITPEKGMWAVLPDGDIELIIAVSEDGKTVQTTSLVQDEMVEVERCVLLPSLEKLIEELSRLSIEYDFSWTFNSGLKKKYEVFLPFEEYITIPRHNITYDSDIPVEAVLLAVLAVHEIIHRILK
jgi:hypothetical protein